MDTARHLEALDLAGRLLADAAERAGADADVPTCPGWQVRDLLRHTGAVHVWAASFVRERLTEPRPIGEAPDLDGKELTDWYRDSHRRLVDTLADAPEDVAYWTFHPAPNPSPLAFWTRRQAHETTVHRFDAQAALGVGPDPVDAEFAEFTADGIDELLRGFHARSRSRVRTEVPCVLRVRASDTDAVWSVRLSPKPPVTTLDADGPATTELSGTAGELYFALWNRLPVPHIAGDRALADLWRELSGIG
ncbi:maleylpyruvate isomerase family mycothiol-dependent enzyme [Streptomyces sp. NPDC006458]|uniref:maleylpyruvate isomerase family mycothiol-dependent enzyme n=1 Tax=Streptomyces sp. NPDC006458 TaxID=3154302 RepID=UPI00339DB371